MKRRPVRFSLRPALLLLMICGLLLPLPGGSAQERGCEGALSALQGTYCALTTLTARFRHTLHAKTLGQEEVEEGTLYLAARGRMRWQYETPKGKLAVSDGARSWLYLSAENQVFVQKVSSGAEAPLALRLLSGEADLRKEFTCLESRQADGVSTLRLKPNAPIPDLQEVEVRIGAGGLLQRVAYTDGLGNEIILEFWDLATGGKLDASLFSFQPPRGVRVLEAGGD